MKKLIAGPASLLLGALLAMAQTPAPSQPPKSIAAATRDNPFVNSLGMKFVPVPGTNVLFSIWDTRVEDFQKFVQDTGYDATGAMVSLASDGFGPHGATWKDPGFKQGPDYPVVGVSWNDSTAFCAWLTKKEQTAALIGPDQEYHLPTDKEWSAAVGGGRYPWGDQWPPPAGAGNYAGREAKDANWPANFATLEGYEDGFPRTSPVGSFAPNKYGLFDMGGNVAQWCVDWYRKRMNEQAVLDAYPSLKEDGGGETARVARGSAWNNDDPIFLLSSFRNYATPDSRGDIYGFRCVLSPAATSP